MSVETFTLIRQTDGLTYHFNRADHPLGYEGFKRRDGDYWIVNRPSWGWVALDFARQEVHGRPWDVPPDAQTEDAPPEGIWVSRKGAKSYVYDLRYAPHKT